MGMKGEIEKATEMGFCFGVRRAIDMLEKAAHKYSMVETLGAAVHNEQVVERLSRCGVKVVENLDELHGTTVAIASHGVGPAVLDEISARRLQLIDTTCPFVRRAQNAARRLANAGFFVIIFGDADHQEVEGVLGWAGGNGIATLDGELDIEKLPPHIGILSQTTQSPAGFANFIKVLTDSVIHKASELRIINTICDATRRRQASALELARRVELMVVVGGYNSANTQRLAELCSGYVETHLIETAEEIDPACLQNRMRIGVTAGTSTPDEVINEVLARLGGS